MNRAWAASLSNFWHSTNWPMWLTILVAAVVVIALVIVFFRSDGEVTKGPLIFVAVLAAGTGAYMFITRGSSPSVQSATSTSVAGPDRRPATPNLVAAFQAPLPASLPALSCLDGIAGESVENACEKALFSSADSTAAAVSYAAAQMGRLAAFGTASAADKIMTPELKALRRTIERDRYGLVAQVLATRDGCTSTSCAFFQSLTTSDLIAGNMNEKLYDGLVGRYSPFWNAPAPSVQASPVAAAPGPLPGRPVSGDFPSASSIPPVNIMTPEPGAQGTQSSPRQAESSPPPRAATAPKKMSAQKSRAQAPTSLAPQQADDDN